MGWVWGLMCVLIGIGAYWLGRRHAGRSALYRSLANIRGKLTENLAPLLRSRSDNAELASTFTRDKLIFVEGFVEPETLEAMRTEALGVRGAAERSYIPTHKKGGTICYERIHYVAPRCLAFYHSPAVHAYVSSVVGEKVMPTADHDQSSCSLLIYDEAGDHINWHYDHNFYNGRHFTVLLSLHNRAANGGVSSSNLYRKTDGGEEISVSTAENNLVIFEGAKCLHRATATVDGDLRILLSMTFATTPKIGWFNEVVRRFKDTAYYGVRVLWD